MAALSYEDRDARIFALKQMGQPLKMIAEAVGLGTSRVGQILQETGGATDRWVCPACGDLVARLNDPSGWCDDCDDRETSYQQHHYPWSGMFGSIPPPADLGALGW